MTPTRQARMPARQCFMNATLTGLVYGWTYVEGYALAPDHGIVDNTGQVWELTYPAPALAYIGVVFSVERADDCMWNGDATVLEDAARGYPLLAKRWTGEPHDIPQSERLDLLAMLFRDNAQAWALSSYGLPGQPVPLHLTPEERAGAHQRLRALYAADPTL